MKILITFYKSNIIMLNVVTFQVKSHVAIFVFIRRGKKNLLI